MEERRQIWMRLGVTLHGTADEIERILKGDWALACELIHKKNFDIEGDSYIPAESIEDYNNEYGTDHPLEDI